MAVSFRNYSVKTTSSQLERILTGSTGSTIVKSLQIINGNQSCTVNVVRKDANNVQYANVRVDLKANDYLLLWEGFFVIPFNHTLNFSSSSAGCTVVANVVELS